MNQSPPDFEVVNMTKTFGPLVALDQASLQLPAGQFHALLGENGAGKSTLVKCVMGYYHPDQGDILIDKEEAWINNPREAHEQGVGMVYQHFTLIPNMTVTENLVMARTQLPAVIDWRAEQKALQTFMETMPFQVPLTVTVSALSAGEKQKLEIIKQLYLKTKILILDEPTSVLTPQEADEILGLLHQMTQAKQLSVLMITHKFREVVAFADAVTVLRKGKWVGSGKVSELTTDEMAAMMIGEELKVTSKKREGQASQQPKLEIEKLKIGDDTGSVIVEALDLSIHAGEIVGIAGVSGNGQKEFIEVLAGQRQSLGGTVKIHGEVYHGTRQEMLKNQVYCLPEEPIHNACVGHMSVAENMAFRNFDTPLHSMGRWLLKTSAIKRTARSLIERYQVKTPSPDTPIKHLSGGNIQRAVLARELSSKVEVLIVANPCFGLDFLATDEIRSQIMQARNKGVAVLLVSEDLDEILELSDRILVVFNGQLVYQTTAEAVDLSVIGQHMAGH